MSTCVLLLYIVTVALLLATTSGSRQFQKLNRKLHVNGVKRKPIVLVPGILGSRLQAKLNLKQSPGLFCKKKSDWFDLWLNFEELLVSINCWVYDISVRFDNLTNYVENQDGVTTRVLDFGGTSDFEFLDTDHFAPGSSYFNELVDFLISLGYERRKDLKGAPYDWRYTPLPDFVANLTKLIESNYYEHNNQKVVVIGHSMGNMNIYYLLRSKSQEWKDKFIDSFISISSPYIGSVKGLKAIISGETEGHDKILPRLKFRAAARTFPSSFYLLPRLSLWPKDKIRVVDTFVKNFTIFDYEELFNRIQCKNCWKLWKQYGEELGDLRAPGVPVHCVYSSQVPTAEVLLYGPGHFPDGSPDLKTGDGDGTVNIFSSSYCLNWRKQQNQPVYDAEMPGNTHLGILKNATLRSYIGKVVTTDSFEPTLNPDVL